MKESSGSGTSHFSAFSLFSVNCKCLVYKLYITYRTFQYMDRVYVARYLVLAYIERLVSTVCYYLSYFCLSVNCMNWICKLHNISPTCLIFSSLICKLRILLFYKFKYVVSLYIYYMMFSSVIYRNVNYIYSYNYI